MRHLANTRRLSILASAASLALCWQAGGAAARLTITDAKIENGRLIVTGTATRSTQNVILDGRFRTSTTGGLNTYTFRLNRYHPSDCIVEVRAAGQTATAVVANCGPTGVSPRGRWSPDAEYLRNDLVLFEGSTWRARVPNQDEEPGESEAWQLFAAKGEKGERGERGLPGRDGKDGEDGEDGKDGRDGEDGKDGQDGRRGPPGVVKIVPLTGGPVGSIDTDSTWQFAGRTASLPLTATQRLTGSASLPITSSDGESTDDVDYDLCYRDLETTPLADPAPISDLDFQTATIVHTVVVATSGTIAPGAAGSYEFGFCVRTRSSLTSLTGDNVHGWVMVTNEPGSP
jgi:hypothetical protein